MTADKKKIEELRKEISKIDKNIVQLLDSRTALAKKIGQIKNQLEIPIIDLEREKKILDEITKKVDHLTKKQLHTIYKNIIAISRAVQGSQKRVALLGPAGTYSEQAAKIYFSEAEADFVITKDINDIFRKVIAKEVDYGVVPVENSTFGSVPVTLDLLLESNLKIVGEIILRIKLNLIALKKIPLSEIKTLLSHENPLGQCRKFIEENLSQAKIIKTKSTSKAVELISKYEDAAAIGTELAAELYERLIISKRIEDNQNNYTRFFVIGHEETEVSGNDKTSIVFSVRHVPGALLAALKSFSSRNINLTKLESRPSRLTPWEYYFYTDFEGHISDDSIKEALKELKKNTLFIKILGSYPTKS
ncbi:MAG: prephenate dehydratase [Promethearchaeota archaeon]